MPALSGANPYVTAARAAILRAGAGRSNAPHWWADTSEIERAVIARLAGDATLLALMTDGVYMDLAPAGKTRFVVVSQSTHADDYVFEGGAFEEVIYLVKAVDNSASGSRVKTAAARIHTLLQDAALTVAGYSHCLTRREERIRYTEVDEIDGNIRWQHRGGRYQVVVSPRPPS